jgi:hypothetical protein
MAASFRSVESINADSRDRHAVNLQLPDWFYQHEDFKRACHLANFIISA